MLKFKVKQLIEAHGVKHPAIWLMKTCSMNRGKAYKIINNQQEMISLKDFSQMCQIFTCTPNDLMYWENTPDTRLPDTHPCRKQMSPPDKYSSWPDLIKHLPHEDRREFRDLILKKLEEQEEERRKQAEEMKAKREGNGTT